MSSEGSLGRYRTTMSFAASEVVPEPAFNRSR
jgi:hypothetical protein